MKLIITEKPNVAKSIASALGVTSRADGYFKGNGYLVSWYIGHLVELEDRDNKIALLIPSCASSAGESRGGQRPHCFPGVRPGHPRCL